MVTSLSRAWLLSHSVESYLIPAHSLLPAIEKGGRGLAPGRESWPGFPAGMLGSLCAVADCLAPVYAKGMEVVAPPASQRPAGSKTEREAEGMFGHKAGWSMPAGRSELWGVWHTKLFVHLLPSSASWTALWASLCFYEKRGLGPQMPVRRSRGGEPERQ